MPLSPLRWPAIAVAVLLVLACGVKPEKSTVSDGVSPNPTGVQAQEIPTAQLGQTITLTGGIGDNEIAVTVLSAKTYSQAADHTWIKPAKGSYIAAEVEVKVIRGQTYACICDFALVAGDGSLFEPVWGAGFNQAMQNVTLNVGEKAGGLVVFDVPPRTEKGAVIQLRPEWTNAVRGKWAL